MECRPVQVVMPFDVIKLSKGVMELDPYKCFSNVRRYCAGKKEDVTNRSLLVRLSS